MRTGDLPHPRQARGKVLMPPMKELIAYEKDCKSDQPGANPECGRIPVVAGNTVK